MPDLDLVFATLRGVLAPHAEAMQPTADDPGHLSLDTRTPQPDGKPVFFGSVRQGKSAVSFHLMPVYLYPGLLDDISPALRKRMSGKSCFSFRAVEPELVEELRELTRRGWESYREAGLT